MKKLSLLILLIFVINIVLMPVSSLNAKPTELVTNGDFETGDITGWYTNLPSDVNILNIGGNNFVEISKDKWNISSLTQSIDIETTDLDFSCLIWPKTIDSSASGKVYVAVCLYDGINAFGCIRYDYNTTQTDWIGLSYNVAGEWQIKHPTIDISSADRLAIYLGVQNTYSPNGPTTGYFDDISLIGEIDSSDNIIRESESKWVRPMPMTCWQIWINEDNNFEFIFWYPYKDNNWVRIYDMEGNMVFEKDLPLDDPNLIVDLPDGYYWVKTFHGLVSIQEFLIGKPAPEM